MSRARVTQLLNLLKLPAEIRQEILVLLKPTRRQLTERRLRPLLGIPSDERQVTAFSRLKIRLDIR